MTDPLSMPFKDRLILITPCSQDYLESVTACCANMARLCGMADRALDRCLLVAEELFMHMTSQCTLIGYPGQCRLELGVLPDGLELCFTTDHLAYDPEKDQDYSLDSVLENGDAEGLGLHLIKAYAQSITLTKKGRDQTLCLIMAGGGGGELGARPWSRLVPSLAGGVRLSPMEYKGKRIHRLDDEHSGKSFRVRALAHQALTLIDGKTSFGSIMARTLKVMPEVTWNQVEDLFEVLIDNNLVTLKELPRRQAEFQVKQEMDAASLRALEAYRKAGEEEDTK